MTQKELEQLLAHLESKHRSLAFSRYKPHNYQREVHTAVGKHRVTLLCGGNGIGKTLFLAAEALAWVTGERPWDGTKTKIPPSRVLMVGPDFTNYFPKKLIPTIFSLMPLECWESHKKNPSGTYIELTHPNGSVLEFMSYEQHLRRGADQASPFEGIDWDIALLDEPGPKEVYVPISRGVMKRNGRLVWALTPVTDPWIWDELYQPAGEDPDIYAKTVSIFDAVKSEANPTGHLDQGALQKYVNDVKGRDDEDARLYGKFKHLIGLVYKDANRMVHGYDPKLVTIGADWPKGIVIDPADRRPWAMIWFAVAPDGKRYVYREWPTDPFHFYRYFDNRWDDYAQMIKKSMEESPGGTRSFRWLVIDPNFGVVTKGVTGESIVARMAKWGLYFRTDIDNTIEIGHAKIRKLLSYDTTKPVSATNSPQLMISKDCWNMWYAFEHYRWKTRNEDLSDTRDIPSEDGKDFMDVLRYMEAIDPRYLTPETYRPKYRMKGLLNSGLGAA
jgi:hypothetical protein